MNYRPQLDGLRALAVLAVAWSHWERDYQFGIPFGAGVHLFYVLSGFLITGILLNVRDDADRAGALRAFYLRRALRIFPAFYLTLALAWWADVPLIRDTFAWHAAYLSNVFIFLRAEWPGTISHLWSLAVEEQFYLLWPWLVVLAPRRWLIPSVIAAIVGSVAFRWLLASFGYRESLVGLLLPGSLDSLAVGALLAIVIADAPLRLARLTVVSGICFAAYATLLVSEGAGLILPLPLMAMKQTLQAVVFAWLVVRASEGFDGITGRVLASRPMVYIGKISYGIYLAHGFAGVLLFELFAINSRALPEPWRFVILAGISLATAALSWVVIEHPINRLKRLFPYSTVNRLPTTDNRPPTTVNRQPSTAGYRASAVVQYESPHP